MYCYSCMNELKEGTDYCYHCAKKSTPDNIPHHLAPGTILENKYLVGNALGEGGFGITYIGYDLNLDLKIAIKEFYPSGYANRNNTVSNKVTLNYQNNGEYFKKGRDSFLREAKSIAKFSKESGIVDVRDFFTENDTAYIIMEYIDGVTLSKHTSEKGLFDACEIFKLMIPIMKSLEKMHKEGIIHRDISPDNIMYTEDGTLKLMDFGSARYFSGAEQKTMSVVLKPGYAPYEQYSSNGNQGPWTDVYGLCATLYKCITGKAPVDSLDRCQNDTLKKPSELGINIPPSLENVLMYGLAVYHDNRCQSMEELIEITEKALKNEQFNLKNAGNTSAIDDIYKTKAADEKYKTMFADSAYETDNVYSGNRDLNENQYTQQPNPPQKNNKALIIVMIILTIVIVAAVATITALLVTMNTSDDNQKEETTTVSESADEKVTDGKAEIPTTIDDRINMIDVENKKLSDAKKELESAGFKVEITKQSSNDVAKDYVIRQSIESGQLINKGETVMLYVSKGSSVNTEPYDQKVVVSASPGSSYATLKLYNWKDGEWVSGFECDATVGQDGISSSNNEGNNCTPLGTFPLGVVLSEYSVNTNLNTRTVNEDTVICDDENYPEYYNQIFQKYELPSIVHYDRTGEKICSGENNALIFIEHNGNGFSSSGVIPGKSSAITICGCNYSIAPTYGCIDISSSDMATLLNLLDSGKNPYIITEVN